MIKLETDHLVIRDYTSLDLDNYMNLFTNPKVQYYLPHLRTSSLENIKNIFEEIIEDKEDMNRKNYLFAVIEKETSSFVGEVGFVVTTETPQGKRAEMGYFTLPQHWGKGYVTEATHQVIRYAFENCDVHKIVAGCIKDNEASENVMKRCNMKKEAQFVEHVWLEGKWRDNVRYGLLKRQWQE